MTERISKNQPKESLLNNSRLKFSVLDTGCNYFDGTKINNVQIEVTHGSGLVYGTNCLSLNLELTDKRKIPGGGYDLKNGEFYYIGGNRVDTKNGNNMLGPIFDKLENHFKENPKDLAKIERMLQYHY